MPRLLICLLIFCLGSTCLLPAQAELPTLRTTGNRTQLIVDEKPFLILGGELGNSSFTSEAYMAPIWPKLQAMHLNTILAPVYWELIEPTEGTFDFSLYDQLITTARDQGFRLVLLWFGSYKNSMSSHVPAWVKQDAARFPRVQDEDGRSHEILTPFSPANLQADLKAFQALMAHLEDTDPERTVIMVQVENEIGMLPTARDFHPLAQKQFEAPVPTELMTYLRAHREQLSPELRERWEQQGFPERGSWEEVFGPGLATEECFMAWHFARYTQAIAGAGKEVYPLPLFVNAALNAPGKWPGQYPSAGPLPHVKDFWLAAGNALDFLSPDFYNPDFEQWCDRYTWEGNPLFVPEHRFDGTVAAKAAFAIGHYEALGFSPFSIESGPDEAGQGLGEMYASLAQMAPLLAEQQGKGRIEGVLLDQENPETVFNLGEYAFTFRHSYSLGWEEGSKQESWEPAGAVIVQTGPAEFYVAGTGVVATFRYLPDPKQKVGILKVDEGHFHAGEWQVTRHLNGDQTHQGRHLRIFRDQVAIQRLELYTYP